MYFMSAMGCSNCDCQAAVGQAQLCAGCIIRGRDVAPEKHASVIVYDALASFHECTFVDITGTAVVIKQGSARLDGCSFVDNLSDVGPEEGMTVYVDQPEGVKIGNEASLTYPRPNPYTGDVSRIAFAPSAFLDAENPGFVALQQVCAPAREQALWPVNARPPP
jgi:hypothetical protein